MASARVLLPALLICLALQLLLLFSSRALGPGEVQPVYPADLVLHAVTLLLTGVCIGRFLIGNPEQRPSSPPFTVTTHAAAASEKSPVISSSKASPYGSMDLLHRVLTQLLENPDSTEPFQLLLTHILEICGTEAGAIFVSSDSDGQLIRLATSCDDYVERFRELLRHHDIRPPMEIDPPPLVLNLPTRPDSHYLVQWLTQGQHGYGVLLLEVNSARNALSKEILASLHSYADYLGGILYSTRRARLKLRNASLLQSGLARNSDHENIAELSNTIVEMRNTLNVAYRHLRELITTFRLTMHGKTFAQALEESIDEFERRSAIAFDLDNRLPAGLLGAGEEMQVLHIVREAIGNVVRHSHATYCGVTVRPTDDSGVQLTVDDNGLGIQSASDAEKHHGTIIMQERAHHLGGTLRVENREHGGTRVCLNIPTRRRAPANPLQSSLAQ
jgi:two-component system nitrate/nitrite sensor histidine kinase NarX